MISTCQLPEQLKPKELEKEGVRSLFLIITPNGEHLKKITGLWEEGFPNLGRNDQATRVEVPKGWSSRRIVFQLI